MEKEPVRFLWDYDLREGELRLYIQNRENPPQHLWAIGRVLKDADPKDWGRFLTIHDI